MPQCFVCKKPIPGGHTYCAEHRELRDAKMKSVRDKLKAEHRCLACGKPTAFCSLRNRHMAYCEFHLEINARQRWPDK